MGNTSANMNTISIKLSPDDVSHTVALLEQKWNEMIGDRPFDYVFVNETFDLMYRPEERIANLTLGFSLLAIFIACMGLFGLSAFTSQQRIKEIGIRKVLGASMFSIIRLISKEYIYLTVLAGLIACPTAYYFLNKWLENFAYREHLSLYIFVFSGALALLIAFFTVSFQSIKAALTNAADTLRHE